MSSEGRRIWSIKIGCATSSINTSSFTFWWFYGISDTTHPNFAIESLWLTHPWGSFPLLIESSHQIKSSFHLYPIFPWWVTVFCFITHFLFDLSSDLSCCSMTELSGRFLWLIDEQLLTDSEMLLSCSGFPHVYKEAVLTQRKGQSSPEFVLSSAFFSKINNSTILITISGLVSKSHKSLSTLITSSECVHIMSSVLGHHKVSEKEVLSINTLNINNVTLTLKVLIKYCLLFALGNTSGLEWLHYQIRVLHTEHILHSIGMQSFRPLVGYLKANNKTILDQGLSMLVWHYLYSMYLLRELLPLRPYDDLRLMT